MIVYRSHSNDPYFNIAAEEYLFENFSEPLLFVYVNQKSVVVGKNQNALAEVYPPALKKYDVSLVRRISGGGAVFHDQGNLNYAFFRAGKERQTLDYDSFLSPVVAFLQSLGFPAGIGSKNGIFTEGKKISGSAQHIRRNRAMHHGTLLVDADLALMDACLRPRVTYQHKGVLSVRASVANLTSWKKELKMEYLIQQLITFFSKNPAQTFDHEQQRLISDKMKEKFKTWAWNYGKSPLFEVSRIISLEGKPYVINMCVVGGWITEVDCEGENLLFCELFRKKMKDTQYGLETITETLGSIRNSLKQKWEVDEVLLQFF